MYPMRNSQMAVLSQCQKRKENRSKQSMHLTHDMYTFVDGVYIILVHDPQGLKAVDGAAQILERSGICATVHQ
jgi:hypothetical protein